MTNFERKLATEASDIVEIARDLLTVQARFAAGQNRPLGRGTHTKGICARARFEVFDLKSTVADPELAARLARGLYAKPGVYPATLRFANAASTIQSDSRGDVRALSFSIQLPPGVAGPEAARVDYSMNNAPTFPINDAHTFASLMKVLAAASMLQKLKAIWSLSFKDQLAFFRAAILGKLQERKADRAYQQMRYWGNVPFSHGPADAVKYSAIPDAANPARPLQNGPNFLQDELVRHLNEDSQMSSFDFGIQFLDADRMTRWGRHRDASFWIENASVEWKETEAPFHTVGRLTLLPKSQLAADACETSYIDVVKNSTSDSRPLGSINRARWEAEEASRKARIEGPAAVADGARPPAAVPVRRSGFRKALGWAAALLVLAALGMIGFIIHYKWEAAENTLPPESIDQVRYLNQGWGIGRESPQRELYYYTPQGTSLHGLRYSWFVKLERPFRRTRLADPAYLQSLNFIVEPVPTPANPDRLPVGFARRYDDRVNDYVVDLTCAACHTGQLNVTGSDHKTTAIRIDGGQGMIAFTDMEDGNFVKEVGYSVATTVANPLKFYRFSRGVLGSDSGWREKGRLWLDMLAVSGEMLKSSRGAFAPKHYPVREGFGRTDALARIANTVFGDRIDPANYRTGNAPVSFPFLWNIWKFDWVQYGASVSQPLARNVGEAMGTGAVFQLVDHYGRPIPESERYRTSISWDNLLRIESTLQTLTPPQWPEDLLGPIDRAKAARGKVLYRQYCAGCHGPHVASAPLRAAVAPLRLASDPLWVIRWKSLQDIGTDPTAAMNFVNNTYDLTRTGLKLEDVRRLLKQQLDEEKEREKDLVPKLQQELSSLKAAGAGVGDQARAEAISELETEISEAQQNPLTDDIITRKLDSVDLRKIGSGDGLNILGLKIRDLYYADSHVPEGKTRGCVEGFGMLDIPHANLGYKPRPHEGVWATPPFLHNGSVPNLYELLSPLEERTKYDGFYVGSREFDPVKVGYVSERVKGSSKGFWFDTKQQGNLNTGHLFSREYVKGNPGAAPNKSGVIGPELSPDQRMELIEYLKSHHDVDPDNAKPPPPPRVPPDCLALMNGSAERQ